MADEQAVYEAIAQAMRDYGYRDVTAAVVREIDEGPPIDDRGVISLFAARQLQQARESGLLLPVAAASAKTQRDDSTTEPPAEPGVKRQGGAEPEGGG